jgi:cytoskeletal protein RodZ
MAAALSDDSGTGRSSPTRAQKDDGAGIGDLLRTARERHGMTLEQLSRETKIPRRHLEALEHDNLAALPGPFYQRAEIRTYARAVNLDPSVVLARLERGGVTSAVSHSAPQPPQLHEPAKGRRQRALIASGLVVVAIVFWRAMPRNLSPDDRQQVERAADPSGQSVAPAATPPQQPADAIDRTAFEPIPAPSTTAERALPVTVEPAEVRPTIGAKGDLPTATKPIDERAPAESATELVVTTEPAGARVTVDGISWGVTPVTIRYLPPGTKRIRVSKEGFIAAERVVGVAEGHRTRTAIRLRGEP